MKIMPPRKMRSGEPNPLLETQSLALDEVTAASYHRLDALADEVYRSYFPNAERLPIRWGKRTEKKRRRSIRLGSYHRFSKLIRIHPLLDSPEVPSFFVQSIIHHEYLHHVLGPNHDRRFHVHERTFRFHREAKQWLRMNLSVLLGRRARPERVAAPPPQKHPSFWKETQQLSLF